VREIVNLILLGGNIDREGAGPWPVRGQPWPENLPPALYMNPADMRDRRLSEFDPIDITSFARDGSTPRVRLPRLWHTKRGTAASSATRPN
jgi:hypothetical protein